MKRWKRPAILLMLLLGAALLALYQKLPREEVEKVTVVEAALGTVEETVSTTGSVEAGRKVLVTADPGFRIAALYFQEQDRVKKGQSLAKLDDAELSTQVRQIQAALELATANLANAEDVLDRTRTLYEKGFVARQEVEAAGRQIDLYTTQIEEKRASLQLLQDKLKRTLIQAPIGGVITRKFVEEGGVVSGASRGLTGSPGGRVEPLAIAEIADLDAPEVVAEVDQTDIAKIRRGQRAVIALDAFPDREFAGVVEEITLSSEQDVRERVRYQVKVKLQKPDGRLRLGMTGTVNVILSSKEDALTLPASVVLQKGEEELVFVVEGGKARFRRVTTGLRNEDIVEIASGVRAGEQVIDQGRGKVKDGQLVEVLNEKQ